MKCEGNPDHRKEAGRLPPIMDSTRDMVMLLSTDGRIRDANRSAVEAYEYSRDELLDLNINQLRAELTFPDLQHQMQAAHDVGILFETTHMRKDGTTFSVEVSSRRAEGEGEGLLVSIIQDISGQRSLRASCH